MEDMVQELLPNFDTGFTGAGGVQLHVGDKVLLFGVPCNVVMRYGSFGLEVVNEVIPWVDIMKRTDYSAAEGKYGLKACMDKSFVSFWELFANQSVTRGRSKTTEFPFIQSVPGTELSKRYGVDYFLPSQSFYHAEVERVKNGSYGESDIQVYISFPVISLDANSRHTLSSFISKVSRNQLKDGVILRPDKYNCSDIQTGQYKADIFCRPGWDFTAASKEALFEIGKDGAQYHPPVGENEADMFKLLDEARLIYLTDGETDKFKEVYRQYMDAFLPAIPRSYRTFYTDLSIWV